MKRASKGYTGKNIPLFPEMIIQGLIVQGEGSTHPVESHHTPTSAPSNSQPPISPTSRRTNRQESMVTQPRSPTQTHVADEAASTSVDVRYGGDTTTVTGLEAGQGIEGGELGDRLEAYQAYIWARIIVSDDEDDLEDPSKQGRKIAKVNQDPVISLVQHDVKIQGRHEHYMEFDFDLDAAKDVSTTEKDVSTAKPVSTAGAAVTIASVAQEQERLGYEAAVRLQVELEEEERQGIVRVHEAASSFNVEEWEDIQARVKADEKLAQRLQAEEREMYTEAEQARMLQLRGYSFDEIKNLFETTMRRVYTFVPIDSEIERVIPELAARSSKRDAEEELDQESSKRQKTVPEQGMNVEALQTKYPIINWEIYTEGTRNDAMESVKERFNSTEPTDDKEREIWVELKRLFEPDTDDELWKLQKHIHDLTWKLYDSCGMHHVSTENGIDIYMLVEKVYLLLRGTLTQMLVAKLLVEQDNEMSRELLRKIFMQVERPRR
ncbi:hypothetical protein Tco_1137043 [Tanacetum coccineum]